MAYQLVISERARGQLAGLDRRVARRMMDRLRVLAGSAETARHKALSGVAGLYTHRTGDYRAIYSLDRDGSVLLVHRMGHRREVYKG